MRKLFNVVSIELEIVLMSRFTRISNGFGPAGNVLLAKEGPTQSACLTDRPTVLRSATNGSAANLAHANSRKDETDRSYLALAEEPAGHVTGASANRRADAGRKTTPQNPSVS